MKENIPFSVQAVADGYWEVYHDDDCGGVITPYPGNLCLKCGMHPDFQSRGARRTGKSQSINQKEDMYWEGAPVIRSIPTQIDDAEKWDDSLAPKQEVREEIDFNALRDMLFAIRDNGTFCPWCRCPEWSSSFPDMRTSHYEECQLGLWCGKLLRLYPKDGAIVKWRK